MPTPVTSFIGSYPTSVAHLALKNTGATDTTIGSSTRCVQIVAAGWTAPLGHGVGYDSVDADPRIGCDVLFASTNPLKNID